jgi:hypothetical protein
LTIALDLGPKLRAYATNAIPQYIVADLVNDRVLVHEAPTGASYSRVTSLRRGDTLRISAGTGHVPIAVGTLLPLSLDTVAGRGILAFTVGTVMLAPTSLVGATTCCDRLDVSREAPAQLPAAQKWLRYT